MDCSEFIELSPNNAYKLLFKVATIIPTSHYILGFLCVFIVFLYNFLEIHLLEDLFTGGSPVTLTYNPSSELYAGVVSKCHILHRRYFATPWISSPHLQTTLLGFVGANPTFKYKRQLFHASDGGTFALDWLMSSDVFGSSLEKNRSNSQKATTPIVVVIPGLTSDSASVYIRNLAFNTAKNGWNVVVCNHRGMGSVSLTSDRVYNAGWTMDIREVINYLRNEYPEALLFMVGTSIGANILVKYLGEDGENVPVAGAVAICSPWDLLIGSRFMARRPVQNLYGRVLGIGLQSYARSNQSHFVRLADWEGIMKTPSIREFDKYATCVIEKFETVDAYYRWCSSAPYVKNVSVPLLCISSLDDPICTAEAIPWDECRANKNIVLATTKHGGHLGFFEGMTASGMWWVRAVNEFIGVFHSSPCMHRRKKSALVSAIGNEPTTTDNMVKKPPKGQIFQNRSSNMVSDVEQFEHPKDLESACASNIVKLFNAAASVRQRCQIARNNKKRLLYNLSRQNRRSMWLVAYLACLFYLAIGSSSLHLKEFQKTFTSKVAELMGFYSCTP